jgi:hypothetical protein
MGNYHVPFWRAVEGVTPSLTLILSTRYWKRLGRFVLYCHWCKPVMARWVIELRVRFVRSKPRYRGMSGINRVTRKSRVRTLIPY